MIKINLLPPELRKKKKVPFIDRTFIYGILTIVGEVIILYLLSLTQQTKIAELESDIATVQLELDKYQDKINMLKEAETLRKELTARMNAVQELENKRAYWVQILTEFRKLIPEYVWIESFAEKSAGVISCDCKGYTLKAIAAFLLNLFSSETFKSAEVGAITQKEVGGGIGYGFSITMKIEPPRTDENLGQFVVDTTKVKEAEKKGGYKGFVQSTRTKFGLYSQEDAKKMFGGIND